MFPPGDKIKKATCAAHDRIRIKTAAGKCTVAAVKLHYLYTNEVKAHSEDQWYHWEKYW